jgi:hypothetical protein
MSERLIYKKIKLVPPVAPNYVFLELPGDQVISRSAERPKVHVSDLSKEEIEELVVAFKDDLLNKAGIAK